MPNIKSQKKRVLITKEENARNNSKKTAVKTVIKKYEAAINEGRIDDAKVLLASAMSAIDAASLYAGMTTLSPPRAKAAGTTAIPGIEEVYA